MDNLNGDNVEWISYPQGTEHVFCYAYYVRPPPTSGTIVIRKETRTDEPATQTFNFDGNLSFNQGGLFGLRVENGRPASETFYRAETGPTTIRGRCASRCPRGGAWPTSTARPRARARPRSISRRARPRSTLVAGDVITCTYVNEVDPPGGRPLPAQAHP